MTIFDDEMKSMLDGGGSCGLTDTDIQCSSSHSTQFNLRVEIVA